MNSLTVSELPTTSAEQSWTWSSVDVWEGTSTLSFLPITASYSSYDLLSSTTTITTELSSSMPLVVTLQSDSTSSTAGITPQSSFPASTLISKTSSSSQNPTVSATSITTAPPASTSLPASTSSTKGDPKVTAIAVGVVGIVTVVAFLIAGIFICWRNRKRSEERKQNLSQEFLSRENLISGNGTTDYPPQLPPLLINSRHYYSGAEFSVHWEDNDIESGQPLASPVVVPAAVEISRSSQLGSNPLGVDSTRQHRASNESTSQGHGVGEEIIDSTRMLHSQPSDHGQNTPPFDRSQQPSPENDYIVSPVTIIDFSARSFSNDQDYGNEVMSRGHSSTHNDIYELHDSPELSGAEIVRHTTPPPQSPKRVQQECESLLSSVSSLSSPNTAEHHSPPKRNTSHANSDAVSDLDIGQITRRHPIDLESDTTYWQTIGRALGGTREPSSSEDQSREPASPNHPPPANRETQDITTYSALIQRNTNISNEKLHTVGGSQNPARKSVEEVTTKTPTDRTSIPKEPSTAQLRMIVPIDELGKRNSVPIVREPVPSKHEKGLVYSP